MDAVYILTAEKAIPLKPPPPGFRNHGNYVTSVSKLGRFLADKAEESGVYILSETAATKLLVEDRVSRACARATAAAARRAKSWPTSSPAPTSSPRRPVLAEGTVGHLTYAAYDYFDMHGADPMRWELGVKEVWEVKEPLDRVIHTMGWPLRKSPRFKRVRRAPHLSDGRGQDLHRPGRRARLHRRTFICHDALQLIKTHPFIKKMLDGRASGVAWGSEDDSLRRLLRDAEAPCRPRAWSFAGDAASMVNIRP
jgi:electron-transferring-flavoprotein dehydrogenase